MSHDYHPSWDYQESRLPALIPLKKSLREELSLFCQQQNLPFKAISVYLVKQTGYLGKYVDGTHSQPVILLDAPALYANCTPGQLEEEVRLTGFHELAHAIQEEFGLEYSEDEAEQFAKDYVLKNQVNKFWQ